MNYEFYADVFFLTNWYLDFLAVYAVGEVLQQKKKLLRYLLGCAVSSLLGCILFLQIENYDFYLLCIHFIVNPGMVIFCFFPAERRIYINAFLLMYFVILMLGGSVQWMYVTVADGHYYELCLILTSVPVIIFLYILRRKRKNVQIFYRVWIEHQGKKIALQALYDTGNCLVDPYISQPVHVVAPEVLSLLGIDRLKLSESLFKSILRQLDLDRVQFDKNMEEYSEGQKKKVLIAGSLLSQAHLYVWDEPLNYIDVFTRMQLEQLILRVQPTMLLVEHDMAFGQKCATKVLEIG